MFNFITLFDKNYISRGIALYDSLVEHSDDFSLYILAMDSETEHFFNNEKIFNRIVIPLSDIESCYPELLGIKKERTRGEYCWTLTPYCIQYAIKKYYLDSCTYIDSDILFYNNPKIIFDESENNSIIITEHRYTPEYDQTKTSGKYCVQFMYFKNDKNGMEALEWWRQRCKEWCYAKSGEGKFGDQKYLDDWITRFNGVYVPSHIGCGIAPWNMQQYEFFSRNKTIIVSDIITKEQKELIFIHFHNIKKYSLSGKTAWCLGNYAVSGSVKEILFKPYIAKLLNIENNLDIILASPVYKKMFFYVRSSFILFYIKNIVKSFFIKRQYSSYKKDMLQYIFDH